MCKMYDINFTAYTETDIEDVLKRPDDYNLTTPVKTKSCNRWKYDPASRFQRTIVTQVNDNKIMMMWRRRRMMMIITIYYYYYY